MDYRTNFTFNDLKSKKWLHADNTIHLKVVFSNYSVKENMEYLMTNIAQYLIDKQKGNNHNEKNEKNEKSEKAEKLPLRGGELHTLKTLITGLEKENERLNRANEKLEGDVNNKKAEQLAQIAMISKLEKLNDESLSMIKKCVSEMEELRKKNKELEENVSNCQFSDALRNFKPENARWEENNVVALKECLLKILKVEAMLHDKINYAESCHNCRKAARQCAMAPCGHLVYCIPCYTQIEQKLTQEAETPKEQPKEAETPKEKAEIQTVDAPVEKVDAPVEKVDALPKVKTIKCPICSIDVASVIKVKN
jgi:hypothetical protein